MDSLKIAILDMYNGAPNEGMRCIQQLVRQFQAESSMPVTCAVFDVRARQQLPAVADYDIYLSSGGPGSPLPTEEPWEAPYFQLIDDLLSWNLSQEPKKYVFLICHSFQLVCRHLGIGVVSQRKSTSFGIFPMHHTAAGRRDAVLARLPEPFYAVDSRDYQVTKPQAKRLDQLGAEVLALEKQRPHVALDRALMAVRFTDEIVGTQFHPEADSEGMLRHFLRPDKQAQVIAQHGQKKLDAMLALLRNPEAIERTEATIIPTFLRHAAANLVPVAV